MAVNLSRKNKHLYQFRPRTPQSAPGPTFFLPYKKHVHMGCYGPEAGVYRDTCTLAVLLKNPDGNGIEMEGRGRIIDPNFPFQIWNLD